MSLPDLRDLGALPPDSDPIDARKIFQALKAEREAKGPRPMAIEGARIRMSWAGQCSRQLAYNIMETPESNPPDGPSLLTFALGQLVHDKWQAGMLEAYPECEIEVKCELPDIRCAGHTDAKVGDKVYEAKSINGFGFKQAVGASGRAEGPRSSAVLQGALNALAHDAEELHIVNISLEQISKNVAKKLPFTHNEQRMCAEWTLPREQWEPLALTEKHRMGAVLEMVDEGRSVAGWVPDMPTGAHITDPATGKWTLNDSDYGNPIEVGTTWQCIYCSYQDTCINDTKMGL